MRLQFLATLLIVAIGATTYWYSSTRYVCPAPLPYRLGQLDDHFAITPEQAIAHMAVAEAAWEAPAERQLFVYDENADFVIDFVFDDRQAFADSEANQSEALDDQRQENERLVSTIAELQESYLSLSDTYNENVASYEARLAAYNQTVQKYNDQGGAPQSEFERLQNEQQALDSEVGQLQVRADELNDLAERLNLLQNESNDRIDNYNRQVQTYNQQFGYTREFTQGDYQGDKINIYKFTSDAELITVLTHEFGHALGIDHVEEEDSVMYYLLTNESEAPTLGAADIEALTNACGTGGEFSHTLRRIIRDAIASIT